MKKTALFSSPPICRLWQKTILIMKLTTFLLLIVALQVSAKTTAQEKVSVRFDKTSLDKALKEVEQKSTFRFVFSNRLLANKELITMEAKDILVEDLLHQLLNNTGLTFSIMDNNLVVIKKAAIVYATITVKGKVTDSKGNPLANVSVTSGKQKGSTTNENGEYSITVDDNATLVFSYVGLVSQTIKVNGRTNISVVLAEGSSQLADVVISVGYGTTTKKKTNSSISTLSMDNVAPLPVASINDAIAGRVPGVIVTTTSGAPGTKSQISIRGGAAPLFVIDNIIRAQTDFENLNPNDIETYSILKDAAATSIYGALGGNGVVLVTTKKGKVGQVNINYSFNEILSQPTIMPKKLSSYDRLNAINKVFIAEGKPQPTPDAILALYKNQSQPYLYPNTDWQKIALKSWAPAQRHDFSISSGTKELTYYASVSNFHQGTILKTDNNYNDRTTYRLNTVSNLDKIHLKVTTGIDGYVESNVVPNSGTAHNYSDLFGHIQNASPTILAYNQLGLPSSLSAAGSPSLELSPLAGYSKSSARVFNSILGLDYEAPFLKGLHIKANGNYNMWSTATKGWNATAPSYGDNSSTPVLGNPPSLSVGAGSGTTLLLQGFITYNKTFGNHSIEFTGGYEQAKSKTDSLYGSRQQYQILFDQFVAGPTVNQLAGGFEAEAARAGYISRLSYNYKSKYYLEGTYRRDGNDLFPPGKRWGNFYAISGGWIPTEETFMQTLKENHVLDYLKLRASYGVTGIVDSIGRFQYVPGYSIDANTWVINGQPVQGSSEPGSIPSQSFSWFNIKSRNLGLDFATLNNKLTGSFDYFYMRTTGYVVGDTRFSSTIGIGLPRVNSSLAALRREGTEMNLTWNDHVGKLNYKIGVNFTYYNQLWERNPYESDAAILNPYTRISGTELTLAQGYLNAGLYGHNSDLLNGPRNISAINTTAGDIRYQDLNGDGKIDASDRRNIGNNTFPHINYGTTVDLSYKGLYVSAVIQGSGNRDRYIGNVIQGGSAQGYLVYGFQENYWSPNNTNALFPRQTSNAGVNGNNNVAASDYWILKSKFLRLKYLQLGYDLKTSVFKRSSFKQLKVFVSGTNLFTSSNSLKYYIDPESDPNNYGYPIQRTVALGVNVGF